MWYYHDSSQRYNQYKIKRRRRITVSLLLIKISADYGIVQLARSLSSRDTDDLLGTAMNVCAKINSMASANGMIIDGNLYYIARELSS